MVAVIRSCALSAASHKDIDPADYRDRKGLDYYYVSCRGDNYIDRPVSNVCFFIFSPF